MVLAVKGSFAMTNRIMPLTAPGHSLMTADREEEKASLVGRHLCTSRFKVLAIRSNDLSAIWLSAQCGKPVMGKFFTDPHGRGFHEKAGLCQALFWSCHSYSRLVEAD